jgi:hypothetical protein
LALNLLTHHDSFIKAFSGALVSMTNFKQLFFGGNVCKTNGFLSKKIRVFSLSPFNERQKIFLFRQFETLLVFGYYVTILC